MLAGTSPHEFNFYKLNSMERDLSFVHQISVCFVFSIWVGLTFIRQVCKVFIMFLIEDHVTFYCYSPRWIFSFQSLPFTILPFLMNLLLHFINFSALFLSTVSLTLYSFTFFSRYFRSFRLFHSFISSSSFFFLLFFPPPLSFSFFLFYFFFLSPVLLRYYGLQSLGSWHIKHNPSGRKSGSWVLWCVRYLSGNLCKWRTCSDASSG